MSVSIDCVARDARPPQAGSPKGRQQKSKSSVTVVARFQPTMSAYSTVNGGGRTDCFAQSFIKWLGEEKYKKLVRFILHYIADLDIPIKRYRQSKSQSRR
jgi:hypothetical protein